MVTKLDSMSTKFGALGHIQGMLGQGRGWIRPHVADFGHTWADILQIRSQSTEFEASSGSATIGQVWADSGQVLIKFGPMLG